MRILGIDPGVATTGYGIVEKQRDQATLLDYGTLTTWPGEPLETRLVDLKRQLLALVELWQPEHVAIERLFVNQNVRTVMEVGMACGVIVLTAKEQGLTTFQYTPLQVKLALTGYGKATKQQIQAMLKNLLSLESLPKPDDAADAVAIALCHSATFPMQQQIQQAERVLT